MNWYFWVGMIAAGCVAIYNIPMFIKILRTKNTSGISLLMYIFLVLGCWLFFLQGIGMIFDKNFNGGLPLLLANLFSGLVSTIILVIKCNNMIKATALNITEKKYCEEKLIQSQKKKKNIYAS